jgi:hypothetical protein
MPVTAGGSVRPLFYTVFIAEAYAGADMCKAVQGGKRTEGPPDRRFIVIPLRLFLALPESSW